jgi:hypothetical protein
MCLWHVHTLANNTIGEGGFAFANAIQDGSAQGLQTIKFCENRIISDHPITINKGGANVYIGNLLQSSSGTQAAQAML